MTDTFAAHGDGIRMVLTTGEADLLRDLVDQIRYLLDHPEPDDPVRQRLFPATVTGDDEQDAELRGLVYDDLLAGRLAGLEEIVAYLDRGRRTRSGLQVDLRPEEAALVLGVLNDLRLALGARIRIEDIDRDTLSDTDTAFATVILIDHLGWWQEQLLRILDPSSVAHYDDVDEDDL